MPLVLQPHGFSGYLINVIKVPPQKQNPNISTRSFNPFQCSSFESPHRAASGPISPDKIGLFWLMPPVENTSPHSCLPIGEGLLLEHSLYGHVNCWESCLLTLPPPPRYSLLLHRAAAKSGAVLAFTQRFEHKDFILWKKLYKVLYRPCTGLSNSF
jgi:hypothetical protein